MASFSNYGLCVDLWSPGVDVPSSTSENNNAYERWDGTSMSAPHITGIVAILLSANNTLTFDDMAQNCSKKGGIRTKKIGKKLKN